MQKTIFSYFEYDKNKSTIHCEVMISSISISKCISIFKNRYKKAVLYYIKPIIN